MEEILLTPGDRAILESYRNLVAGLADYLGEGFEIVLHSLASMEHSVIAIANGHHTGRSEGSPITDLALSMLSTMQGPHNDSYRSYFAKNKAGEPLKSSTIVIFGENGRRIGLLCINFYLNTPIAKLLPIPYESQTAAGYLPEIFADNTDELLSHIVEEAKAEVEADASILPSLKNKEIILRCNAKGVFQIKSAVNSVAQMLGISKNTVYLHLKAEKD